MGVGVCSPKLLSASVSKRVASSMPTLDLHASCRCCLIAPPEHLPEVTEKLVTGKTANSTAEISCASSNHYHESYLTLKLRLDSKSKDMQSSAGKTCAKTEMEFSFQPLVGLI